MFLASQQVFIGFCQENGYPKNSRRDFANGINEMYSVEKQFWSHNNLIIYVSKLIKYYVEAFSDVLVMLQKPPASLQCIDNMTITEIKIMKGNCSIDHSKHK